MDIIILVIVGTAIWVGFDANGRDFSQSKLARSPMSWFLGTLILWIVFFPAYLASRGRYPRAVAARPPQP